MNRRNLVAACAPFFVLLALWPSAGHGGDRDYIYYFRMERPGGYAFDVYVYEGTHEEVYGTLEDCGPMQGSCDDFNNWGSATCGIFQDLYEDGFTEEVRISAGRPFGELMYYFPHYDPDENITLCNAVNGNGWYSDSELLEPLDVEAYWVLAVDVSDFQQAESVEIEQDGVDHTAEFVYGTFNDIFTSDEGSCGVNLSDICAKGAQQANNFSDRIIGALGHLLGVNADGSSDRFYIPYATAGANIKVKFDKFDVPQSDECCDVGTVSRDEPLWWVRFTPRPGGYGSPTCSHRDTFKASGAARSFDPMNEHEWFDGDTAQFNQYYNPYPVGENVPFPNPDHHCEDSDYQGTVGLKSDDYGDEKEHYTYLSSNPILIDIADFDFPQDFLSRLGSLQGTYTRHLRLIHSEYDAKDGLPDVQLHYSLHDMEELYNDGEGLNKYWYLLTTPPGSEYGTVYPKRNGTDEIIDGVASDPDYCIQEDHKCDQGPYDAKDHSRRIKPGESVLYMWQLAEADEVWPDEDGSVVDAANRWYDSGLNPYDPLEEPAWYLLTNITGILFNTWIKNEDDLLAASKFEISHGAAYALAVDYPYRSEGEALRFCRTAMKQSDERVQKFLPPSNPAGCTSVMDTWVLPVSKHATRGTVFTNLWVELLE